MTNFASINGYRPEITFEVELTVRCNAKCIMCPRDATPRRSDMALDTFKVVLDRIEEYAASQPFTAIHLCGLGEPTLHKEIATFARLATERKLHVSLQSNAKKLTPDLSRELVDAGCRAFFISVGGATKETYERVMRGCKFDRFHENIEALLDLKAKGSHSDIFVTMALTPTSATHAETLDVVRNWRQKGVDCFFSEVTVVSRGGAVHYDRVAAGEFVTVDLSEQVNQAGDVGLDSWNAFVFSNLSRVDYENYKRKNEFYCYLKDKLYFIGCDGNYYLGSCDYRKLWPLGSVHELSIAELAAKKACHKKEGLCGECQDWDGLYGLSYDELEPLVHTQGAAQSLVQSMLESANRRGIVRPEQARQGHRAAKVLNLRSDA